MANSAFSVTGIGSGFSSINVQTFTSSGTYTPTSGMAYCLIFCIGGGGGGGGCASSSASGCGGGAGAGALAIQYASSGTIGASQTVTVGSGGSGGSAGNNAGGSGGASSVGSICVAAGGTGGGGGAANSSGSGGAGGTALSSTGIVTFTGNAGGMGMWSVVGADWSNIVGPGGDGIFGGGAGLQAVVGAVGGGASDGSGAGGNGGGCQGGRDAQAGGAGAPGYVFVLEFIG